MKIFNFKLESKLDLHFDVKFNGESNGDSLKAQKPYLRPLYYMAFIDPAPYRHKNERIERQKDTYNHVSFLAGVTLCVLRLICCSNHESPIALTHARSRSAGVRKRDGALVRASI